MQQFIKNVIRERWQEAGEEEKARMMEIELEISKRTFVREEMALQVMVEDNVMTALVLDVNQQENFREFLLQQARSPRWEDNVVAAGWFTDFLSAAPELIQAEFDEMGSLFLCMLHSHSLKVRYVAIKAISRAFKMDFLINSQISTRFQEAFPVALEVNLKKRFF